MASFFLRLHVVRLRFLLLSVQVVQNEAREHQRGAQPLARGHGISENEHRPQDGEELARGRGDGTHQRAEIRHHEEDEILKREE